MGDVAYKWGEIIPHLDKHAKTEWERGTRTKVGATERKNLSKWQSRIREFVYVLCWRRYLHQIHLPIPIPFTNFALFTIFGLKRNDDGAFHCRESTNAPYSTMRQTCTHFPVFGRKEQEEIIRVGRENFFSSFFSLYLSLAAVVVVVVVWVCGRGTDTIDMCSYLQYQYTHVCVHAQHRCTQRILSSW